MPCRGLAGSSPTPGSTASPACAQAGFSSAEEAQAPLSGPIVVEQLFLVSTNSRMGHGGGRRRE
eukprot:4684839-Alexandrium_andersonii.AAC.1